MHKEIIAALLANESIKEAVEAVEKAKKREFDDFQKELEMEEKNAEFIRSGLEMPEGTAGREIAEAVLQELRESNPDAVRIADERIEYRRRMNELEVEIMLKKDGIRT